jgi:putative tryptophan/tyrosine transport system substrate-binding protein
MRRREFIAGLGVAAWPLAARAQQTAMPVIGLLRIQSLESMRDLIAAFRSGLADTGFVEGQNLAIEYRSAEGQSNRLPALAADLVRRQVAVIATPDSTTATFAAKAATRTIPIVFGTGGDPVDLGLVGNLARPAGNLTGATLLHKEVAAKLLETMHQVVPLVGTMAVLINPSNPVTAERMRELQAAAGILGVRLLVLKSSNQSEIEAAFVALASSAAGALIASGDALFITGATGLSPMRSATRYRRYMSIARMLCRADLSATEPASQSSIVYWAPTRAVSSKVKNRQTCQYRGSRDFTW